jgi:hypothetical protein
MRRLLSLTAALAVIPGLANAAEPSCLTPREFTALSNYALPSVINGTTQKCSATLPGDSYLRQSGQDLVQRYSTGKAANWPDAKAAIIKIGAGEKPGSMGLIKSLPDATLQQFTDSMVSNVVVEKLPTERCATIDRVISLLAPLPPESTAELIAIAVGLGAQSDQPKFGKIAICKA